jgi:quinol monooxygenase YgiN
MIVVVGRVHTTPDHRDELLDVARAMCAASRGDDGCLGYRCSEDTEQPDHFVFVEEWEDDAALQAHFAQPHTATFMGSITRLLDGPTDVSFHTIASTRRLGRDGLTEA